MSQSGNLHMSSGKRDFRGDMIDYRNESGMDANQEVNQKLSALTKVLSDATALLKSAGISTGEFLRISGVYGIIDFQ